MAPTSACGPRDSWTWSQTSAPRARKAGRRHDGTPRPLAGGRTVTVHVALSIQSVAAGSSCSPPTARWRRRHRIDNALARAFRWRKQLETGKYASVAEIAMAEKINDLYVGRILRLTLLAPEIIEAIMDGRQAPQITLAVLMRPFPADWENQGRTFSLAPRWAKSRQDPTLPSCAPAAAK
jgi:hypothetical protein